MPLEASYAATDALRWCSRHHCWCGQRRSTRRVMP